METLRYISPKEITANPYQPRLHFDQEKLEELAQSIRENGLIQPIIVRPSSVLGYELLAGERRWRACQLAGLQEIPVIVKELTDDEMMSQAIIENLQRSDLNPIEEALSYSKLLERGLTHEEIAQSMGKSRPYITNSLRLLHLTPEVQEAVKSGEITAGHARILVPFSAEKQTEYLEQIKKEHLSVRQLEQKTKAKKVREKKAKDLFSSELEQELKRYFGTDVKIQYDKTGKGTIQIPFSNLDEFEAIIHTLK